jgi:hypothetical protein
LSFKKGRTGEKGRGMHMEKMSCVHEGRDWRDASTNQGIATIASTPPDVGREF